MSMAIALDNSPETIENIKNMQMVLQFARTYIAPNSTDPSLQMIDDLEDWVGDIYKILTDFTLFTEDALIND